MKNFYKYCKIDQYLYSLIINHELKLSNPKIFNDPFDSNPRLKITEDKELAKNLFELLMKYINWQKKEIENLQSFHELHLKFHAIIGFFKSNMNFNLYTIESENHDYKLIELYTFYNYPGIYDTLWNLDFIEIQNKMFQDYIFLMIDINNYRLSCGSNTPECPVMWGHYADNHRGVCLEFKLFDDKGKNTFNFSKEDIIQVSEINYTNEPIDILNMPLEEVGKLDVRLLSTKSEKWKYEKEIRLIGKEKEFLKFNRDSLVNIIFGCKSTKKDRWTIAFLLRNSGYKSQYLLAKMPPDKYDMKIDQLIFNDVAGGGFHWEDLNYKK